MLFGSKGAVGTVRIHCSTEGEPQNTTYLFVQNLFVDLFVSEFDEKWCGQKIFVVGVAPTPSQSIGPGPHLHVKPIVCGLIGLMGSAPIRDHYAVKFPIPFQNVVEQVLVVAAELVFVFVVGPHDCPGTSFLYCSLEGRKIDLVQCPVIDNHIDIFAVDLLIVQSEMFDAGRYAITLYPVNIRNNHDRGKVGVFSHIFEISTVERCAVDVDTRAKQDSLVAVASLLPDGLAIGFCHIGIPGCGYASQCRKGGAGVVGPFGIVPLVPQLFHTDPMRTIGHPNFRNAETRYAGRTEF